MSKIKIVTCDSRREIIFKNFCFNINFYKIYVIICKQTFLNKLMFLCYSKCVILKN